MAIERECSSHVWIPEHRTHDTPIIFSWNPYVYITIYIFPLESHESHIFTYDPNHIPMKSHDMSIKLTFKLTSIIPSSSHETGWWIETQWRGRCGAAMAYAEVHGLEDIKDNLLFFMYTSYIYVIHRNMSSKDHVFFSHVYIYICKDNDKGW